MAQERQVTDNLLVWHRALDDLALACSAAAAASERDLLARFLNLLENAPSPELLGGIQLIGVSDQEDVLANVWHFIGADCCYMFSRGANTLHIASILLPGSDKESTSSGASLALAVIGAAALALVDRNRASAVFYGRFQIAG